jgi:hypothetical protein
VQMRNGVTRITLAILLPGIFKGIKGDTGGGIADGVDVNLNLVLSRSFFLYQIKIPITLARGRYYRRSLGHFVCV